MVRTPRVSARSSPIFSQHLLPHRLETKQRMWRDVMPHQPPPFSLLHLVNPAWNFTRVSSSLPACSPLHGTQIPVGSLPSSLNISVPSLPWERGRAKSSVQVVCPTWDMHFKHMYRLYYQTHFDRVCIVFAHQLKV